MLVSSLHSHNTQLLFNFQTFFVLMGLLLHRDLKIYCASPFSFLRKLSLIRAPLTFQEVQELKRFYLRYVFQTNLMITDASSSLERYRITFHQQESPLQPHRIRRFYCTQPQVYGDYFQTSGHNQYHVCNFIHEPYP